MRLDKIILRDGRNAHVIKVLSDARIIVRTVDDAGHVVELIGTRGSLQK